MIVTADRETCIGAGTCVNTVPEVFELADDGFVRVIEPEVRAGNRAAVEDAVAMCPVEALALEDRDESSG